MANVKVSALTALPASSATHTYGVTGSSSEGKVAVGGADGLAYFDSSGNLVATGAIPPAYLGTTSTTALAGNTPFNADPQFFQPTTGTTISPTASGMQVQCFVNPAGTLAALTLTLPTGSYKGQTLFATFTQIVTALTVTATNVDNKGLTAPTAAAVGLTLGYVWDSVSAKWNRIV